MSRDDLALVRPHIKFEQSWKTALDEFASCNISGFWNIPGSPDDIKKYIERTKMQAHGLDLPTGFVPASTFWLVRNQAFIGHLQIRHELTDFLKRIGGHVGYAIRPSMWRKGYGTQILTLGLVRAQELGLNRVLVTCDETNIASKKIIESHGGVLEGKTVGIEIPKLRYWIDLTRQV